MWRSSWPGPLSSAEWTASRCTRDDIVLFKDSVLLAEKLMLIGKNFDFVFLPSAVHDAMRKDYVATFTLRKLVEHFDRYLGRGPTGGRPD